MHSRAVLMAFGMLCLAPCLWAQSYRDSFLLWQNQYKQDFLTDARSPLKTADTGLIRFYPYNPKLLFRKAAVHFLSNQPIVPIATHSGKTKRVRAYARIHCTPEQGFWSFLPASWRGGSFRLTLYQILPSGSDSAHDLSLFLPFYDATNGITTYGGGRYLDLSISDIHRAHLLVDFNRAYNPWCAYKEGYSCPIPPEENHLSRAIEAGEKMFVGRTSK